MSERAVLLMQEALSRPLEDEEVMAFADFSDTRMLMEVCLLYTSPSPRDATLSRMPSSA